MVHCTAGRCLHLSHIESIHYKYNTTVFTSDSSATVEQNVSEF